MPTLKVEAISLWPFLPARPELVEGRVLISTQSTNQALSIHLLTRSHSDGDTYA
jgi:hypothetical protein